MAVEKKRNVIARGSEFTGGKILTGALYIVTVFFVLGFFWQSIVSSVLQ